MDEFSDRSVVGSFKLQGTENRTAISKMTLSVELVTTLKLQTVFFLRIVRIWTRSFKENSLSITDLLISTSGFLSSVLKLKTADSHFFIFSRVMYSIFYDS